MGRRRKDVRAIKRRRATREPKRSILIVCEGEKTEPNYFTFFKQKLRLANVNLQICGEECGSDPLSVVEFGESKLKKDVSIDDCFCVIDRDGHDTQRFNSAKSKAASLNGKSKSRQFKLFISDPCIEYWFILHFEFSRTPFVREGQKSRGKVALDRLRQLWPEYEKGLKSPGCHLEERVEVAVKNAEKALADAELTGEMNPSTTVHLLIRELHDGNIS
ncbi:RloB family protein [Aurantiacibacter spongiae]|uniref:RloB domain-containing protein n=1 Tax=Aurantiacibacter spongiae TaxID=2488860 RepID=A0A3N5DG85_9SPHN|nr:RloB family protein [Aurantiacibacter spongiae]RPF70682.1 RloB domain-containing protein [Aurantiacibacter spongiae]